VRVGDEYLAGGFSATVGRELRDWPEVFLVRVDEGCHYSAVPCIGDSSADPSFDRLGVHTGLRGDIRFVEACRV
jgi:hypothetical protein